jgi:hypothetical protein
MYNYLTMFKVISITAILAQIAFLPLPFYYRYRRVLEVMHVE